MTSEDRSKVIMEKKACFKCLKTGHRAGVYKVELHCKRCQGTHYTSLCPQPQKEKKYTSALAQDTTTISMNSAGPHPKKNRQGTVLMEVLLVKLDMPSSSLILRVLFDTGSQQSYIRRAVAESSGLKKVGEKLEQNVVFEGGSLLPVKRHIYDVPVRSCDGTVQRVLKLASCSKINEYVPRVSKGPWLTELRREGIRLTDLDAASEEIDVLIGLDLINQLETGKQFRTKMGLVAVQYALGWIVRGLLESPETSSSMMVSSLLVASAPVHQLWNLDLIGIRDPAFQTTKEENEALTRKHFLDTVGRESDGRYSVSLPWISEAQDVPNNREVAEKRLVNVTKKLQKDGMYGEYDKIFKDWEEEGIVERAKPGDSSTHLHYLPHRPVYKPESTTTPVRLVFDGSCKVGRNPSLNECLERGPNLIELIPNILLRFRVGKIGLVADIRKAFLMVNVKKEERDVLRFLWWENEKCENIREIRHCRVVFGVNCSPFLLAAVIEFYEADGPVNATPDFRSYGFPCSCIAASQIDDSTGVAGGPGLGHGNFRSHEDTDHLMGARPQVPQPDLGSEKMTGGQTERKNWEFHVFCDASKDAYAAAVFLLVNDGAVNSQAASVQLLQCKARVSPLKRTKNGKTGNITIPSLELPACTIGARLLDSVRKALDLDIPTYYWSDSTNALAWIKRNDVWGTFVGNRVREICSLSRPSQWSHIPGVHNPADLPSRGCGPKELLDSKWWEGPKWMKSPKSSWPWEKAVTDEEVVTSEKKKPTKVAVGFVAQSPSVFPYQSFEQNLKFVAATGRFLEKLAKIPLVVKNGAPYTVDELEIAEKTIWKIVQRESGIKEAAEEKKISIEEDETGLIRVRSKLLYRDDSDCFRKPLLLPSQHPLVEQLILDVHLRNNHGGVHFMMSTLREKYWIWKSRKMIQKTLKKCLRCQRYKARASTVPPAPLPIDRVQDAKIFEIIGVDLAGPLFLKGGEKRWLVIFTCAVYRALHLELVTSLSTEVFFMAFYRFVALRGRPTTVYSDNGTNFVGAVNLFRQLDWDKIRVETGLQRIRWKFNPPGAAWWGGFWERLIQEVKKLLVRMLGKSRLTHEQLDTALCMVMATVNSRPLTYVTVNEEDLIPLTPSMFMQEVRGDLCPEENALNASEFQSRYRKLKHLNMELKQRFRSEYLSLLMETWTHKTPRELHVDDVVLVGADNKKRYDWPMARIMELIKGTDGAVRVAKVRTSKGILIRPIQRLFPLELVCSPGEEPLQITEGMKKRAKKEFQTVKATSDHEPVKDIVTTRSGRKSKKPDRLTMN